MGPPTGPAAPRSGGRRRPVSARLPLAAPVPRPVRPDAFPRPG